MTFAVSPEVIRSGGLSLLIYVQSLIAHRCSCGLELAKN